MEAIYAGRWIDIYHDSTKIGHIPLHALLKMLWTKEWNVFMFLQGSHFMANAVQYSRIQTAGGLLIHGRIHHLDSFLNTYLTQLDSTMLFLEWTYALYSTPIITGQLEFVDRPIGNIIKQHMYLPPGQPDHIQLHIDCCPICIFYDPSGSFGRTSMRIHAKRYSLCPSHPSSTLGQILAITGYLVLAAPKQCTSYKFSGHTITLTRPIFGHHA